MEEHVNDVHEGNNTDIESGMKVLEVFKNASLSQTSYGRRQTQKNKS